MSGARRNACFAVLDCVCSTFEVTACTERANALPPSEKFDDKFFDKRGARKPKAVVTKALAGSANLIWQTPQLSVRLAEQAGDSRRRQKLTMRLHLLQRLPTLLCNSIKMRHSVQLVRSLSR